MKSQYIEVADKRRNEWATGDAKRNKGLVDREDVRTIEDIVYTGSECKEDEIWHLADIYYPTGTAVDITKGEKYPVIVSVHGGGWFYGDKKLYRHYCMKLASYGYAVVNFNYRLSPEHQYPAGFMDVCHLMEFVHDNADKYSLDMERLYAVGDSAGAQLLSQYSVFATNPEYKKLLDPENKITSPIPCKVALNCGIYEMKDMDGREDICEWYLDDDTITDLDGKTQIGRSFFGIMNYVTDRFPETYLMTSYNDPLKVHTEPMKKKLEELGVKHVFKEWCEGSPEDGHVFHVNMKSDFGIKCNDEEIAFFKGELNNK